MAAKNGSTTWPVTNMWWAHTDVDSAAIASVARIEALVPEQRLAGEHREDLGDHAEERQGDDVHLGVAEEPEQVLPQDRRPAGRRVEEVGAEAAGRPRA